MSVYTICLPLAADSFRVGHDTLEDGLVAALRSGVLDLSDELRSHHRRRSPHQFFAKRLVIGESHVISDYLEIHIEKPNLLTATVSHFLSLCLGFAFAEHLAGVGDHVCCARHLTGVVLSLNVKFYQNDQELMI